MFTKTRVKTSDILTCTRGQSLAVPCISVRAEGTTSSVLFVLHVQLHTAIYSYSCAIYVNSGLCILDLDAAWFGRKLQTLRHLQGRKLRPLVFIILNVLFVRFGRPVNSDSAANLMC
jgi:hypothetical protein